MVNKYAEELKLERESIAKSNPFSKKTKNVFTKPKILKNKRDVPFISKRKKESNYFTLILESDFQDLEMDIRGLREYKEIDDRTGRERVVYKRRPNHYLSEDGAEDLLLELRTHLSSDIKLAIFTRDEFLQAQDTIRKALFSYIGNNLYHLGMETEKKQRNAAPLLNRILLRIRAVYSRSVGGLENERSHGDIKISGDLDMEKEDRFRMEDMKN